MARHHVNRTHLKKLQEWGPVNAEALSILHGSGFDLISKINTGFKTNWKLINEFVNAYDDEGYCFVFGDKKITPTLEDVARITGFPIDGTAVTGKDFGEDACKKLSVELLNDDYVLPGSSEIIFSKLLECRQFENAEQINFYVRAYALFVIACYVLPGKSQDAVPCMYLSLLEDVNKIKDYAWGSALLCQMHNELAAHKKHGTKTTFAFCVPFVEIFFFEHFPMLPKTLYDVDVANVDHSTELSEFPLVVGWTSLLELKTKNSYTRTPVNDVLNVENICWQPYKRLPNNFLPLYLQLQMPVSSAFTVMICFSKFAWHLPFTCPLKFGREEGEVLAQSYDVFKLQSKRRNAIKVDWETFHPAKRPMESWKSRLQNIVYPSYYEGDVVGDGGFSNSLIQEQLHLPDDVDVDVVDDDVVDDDVDDVDDDVVGTNEDSGNAVDDDVVGTNEDSGNDVDDDVVGTNEDSGNAVDDDAGETTTDDGSNVGSNRATTSGYASSQRTQTSMTQDPRFMPTVDRCMSTRLPDDTFESWQIMTAFVADRDTFEICCLIRNDQELRHFVLNFLRRYYPSQ